MLNMQDQTLAYISFIIFTNVMSIFISITKFETGVWKACDLNYGNSIFYLQIFTLHAPTCYV